jgi:hypothetical protein
MAELQTLFRGMGNGSISEVQFERLLPRTRSGHETQSELSVVSAGFEGEGAQAEHARSDHSTVSGVVTTLPTAAPSNVSRAVAVRPVALIATSVAWD